MTGTWQDAALVAIDLEGTGGQDGDQEDILEIALVPLHAGTVQVAESYTTVINPGRHIAVRPWLSPGLTNQVLADSPPLDRVEPELATRLHGRILVGHNVGVDWRLLHRRCPTVKPAGLIDTLRLARHLGGRTGNSLTALLDRHNLTRQVTDLAAGSQPHRALWDAIGAGLLLAALAHRLHQTPLVTLEELYSVAGIPLSSPASPRPPADHPGLF
ncbi:DNA polymerase III epsilon subunit-like 3'-5' exonuclease [Frankia torreyi]|uniref:DNA polymerase III epsilon subunit-like 3'-5' exonuclease n=1 Tax=Frankia torreyi TaxID=1856 RepID=A0A0D8B9Q7_9ACTN|nr:MULTISPECIES: 3'-5' exonuclease [Frankia]KJE20112.1 DNA polymerase III epsilon subunit-like 3'-5' exonuclease [Frankia torreyi]